MRSALFRIGIAARDRWLEQELTASSNGGVEVIAIDNLKLRSSTLDLPKKRTRFHPSSSADSLSLRQEFLHRMQCHVADMMFHAFAVDLSGGLIDANREQKLKHNFVPFADPIGQAFPLGCQLDRTIRRRVKQFLAL